MSKQIIAYCTSGLGNRLITLVGALYWAKFLDIDFKIVWPTDNECMVHIEDIFSGITSLVIGESEIFNNREKIIACGFLYQKDNVNLFINDNKDKLNPGLIKALSNLVDTNLLYEELKNRDFNTLIYNDINIPRYIRSRELKECLSFFKIKPDILSDINNFIEQKNISINTSGILIRKTDGELLFAKRSDQDYLDIIQANKTQKYFLTSDDQSTENNFKQNDNVICYPKKENVQYENNKIFRSRASVIDAFKCMLILSKTNILDRNLSQSSFLKMAVQYSNIKF